MVRLRILNLIYVGSNPTQRAKNINILNNEKVNGVLMYRILRDNEIVKHIVVTVNPEWDIVKEIKYLEFVSYEKAWEIASLWENAKVFYHEEEMIDAA